MKYEKPGHPQRKARTLHEPKSQDTHISTKSQDTHISELAFLWVS